MISPTTAGALTEGTRVRLTTRTDRAPKFSRDPEAAYRPAVVLSIEPAGRRRVIRTDLGDIETGPAARVLLAPAEAKPDKASTPVSEVARATVDEAGRLTAASTLTIGGITVPIPELVDCLGGQAAPVRLRVTLADLGWHRISGWDSSSPGVVAAKVTRA